MSGKRTSRGGGRKRPRARRAMTSPLLRILGAVGVLAVLVIGAVLMARFLAAPEPRALPAERKQSTLRPPASAPAPRTAAKEPETKTPVAAAPDRSPGTEPAPAPKPPPQASPAADSDPAAPNSMHAALPPSPPERPPVKVLPRVAIIIDDVGYDRPLAEKFIGLNAGLTLSILPHSPHQQAIARSAHAQGVEIMLHLPMEPVEYPEIKPGPGALLASLSPDELLQVLEGDLKAVPHVRGVNNHMGSKLTTQSEQIHQVFSVLKRRGLFFVDSRTTEASVCQPSARLLQLPFAQRDVFLDHVQDPAFIRKQVRELVRLAKQKGEALGIGHPHPATYSVLREMLPELRQQVEMVPASRLVRVVEPDPISNQPG